MGIIAFSPYGLASEESGLVALVSSYLNQGPYTVSYLRCNGIFSLCDRDGDYGWRRGIRSCFGCTHEQSSIADWAGLPKDDLSAFLTPDHVQESKRWALGLTPETMRAADFHGLPVFEFCRESFRYRFGTDSPDLNERQQEEIVRRVMVSAARSILAIDKYLLHRSPEACLVAGGHDFMTRCFVERVRSRKIDLSIFRWDLATRSVKVVGPRRAREIAHTAETADAQEFECPLVFDDVTSLRSDARTWPRELTKVLDDLLVFLDLSKSQIELPLAQ